MKGESVSVNFVYLLVFVVSIVLLIFGIRGTYEGWYHFDEFIKELGFAGIIAIVLVFTIERFTRSKHEHASEMLVEKINKDLFFAIFRRFIPQAILREFDEHILRPGIFRTDHEVRYTFWKFEDKHNRACEKYLKCSAEANYRVINISQTEIKHDVVLCLENPIDGSHTEDVRILSVEIEGRTLSTDEIIEHTSLNEMQLRFSFPIVIKPLESCVVSTKAELIKNIVDQEIWSSRLPSDGIRLTVCVPDANLDVMANALHPDSLVLRHDNGVLKEWDLRRGMLPYQSVVFWWKPKEPLTCPAKSFPASSESVVTEESRGGTIDTSGAEG